MYVCVCAYVCGCGYQVQCWWITGSMEALKDAVFWQPTMDAGSLFHANIKLSLVVAQNQKYWTPSEDRTH